MHSTNPLFIQHMIHDIQGDFLGVAGLCQSMKKGLEDKKDIAGLLDILIENCRTYKYKLGNFLEFTRMQTGLTRTVRSPASIRRLLNQVIDEYEPLWVEKDARIELGIAPGFPDESCCDEGKIQLVVSNLFVNAVCFSPPGRTITVTAGFGPPASPEQWTIGVIDNGDGMTEQQVEAAFSMEPAGRAILHNSAGLGLIISRWLSETVLGGKMQLTSRPGMGTDVRVNLPFYPYE
jgi:signal transduction histidine kinase